MLKRSVHIGSATPTLSIDALRKIEAQGLARGLPLMQRAGEAAAEWAMQIIAPNARVLVLVGPGNNGGDALVTARLLAQNGFSVTVVRPLNAAQAPADAQAAASAWLALGHTIHTELPTTKPDWVIDGLFGIGLSRPLAEPYQSLIDTINRWQIPVLALDIASGIDAQTGQPLGQPIQAKHTLAFIAPCHAFGAQAAQPFLGHCRVATLDI